MDKLLDEAEANGLSCSAIRQRVKEVKQYVAQGWTVCRLHGAGGGAQLDKAHPNYKHGMRTKAWTKMRREINQLLRLDKALEDLIQDF